MPTSNPSSSPARIFPFSSGWFSYGFVEWEDATAHSLFRSQGKKATPEWSARLDHAHSQIIDWFWKLDDMRSTEEFRTRFGRKQIHPFGLVVAGRDSMLSHPRERDRWLWRCENVACAGLPIFCLTYDELCRFLVARLSQRELANDVLDMDFEE